MQGAWVQSLVGIPHVATKIPRAATKRSLMLQPLMPQLKILHVATKIPHAATKTQHGQINIKKKKKTWRKYIKILPLVILRWRDNKWVKNFCFSFLSFPNFLSWKSEGISESKTIGKNKGTNTELGSGVVSALLMFPLTNSRLPFVSQEVFSFIEFLGQAP